jgi:hypothetical protein
MAIPKFLDVDGDETFSSRPEIMKTVFESTKINGEDFKRVPKTIWKIKDGKKVWFPYIAKQTQEGHWIMPKQIGWTNIPSSDRCSITQIRHSNYTAEDDENASDEILYAVFICTDPDADENYRFYGIFTREEDKENCLTKWTRKNSFLNLEEWKAEQ